ncbi:MAG TPA: hypothetical protein VFA07_05390 [Chthonomonadaceae bacterium]|nr:hypothetical protein [Chthonomonadaceae bacterium]
MRVHVNTSDQGLPLQETFTGNTAEEVVGAIKKRVTQELPFALRLAANTMSNLAFAQEIVRRYNKAQKRNLPLPASCEDFLRMAQEQGIAQIEKE